MAEDKTWLVTGASKGLGKAIVDAIAQRGEKVGGTFRHAKEAAAFEASYPGLAVGLVLDVTDDARIPGAVDEAISKLGRLDVLVNNAGYGQFGALEDLSNEQIRKLMDTNFFGAVNMIRAVLPHFRSRRAGHIANISSLVGFSAIFAGSTCYCASKFALEGLSESLALEIAPFGIGITIVEPGTFRTEFGAASMDMSAAISADYQAALGPIRAHLTGAYSGTETGDPVRGAQALLAALDAPKPPARLILGTDALAAVRQKLDFVAEESRAWEALSCSTDFPAGVAAAG